MNRNSLSGRAYIRKTGPSTVKRPSAAPRQIRPPPGPRAAGGADGSALARSRLWGLPPAPAQLKCIRNTALWEAPPLRQQCLVTGPDEGSTASPLSPHELHESAWSPDRSGVRYRASRGQPPATDRHPEFPQSPGAQLLLRGQERLRSAAC